VDGKSSTVISCGFSGRTVTVTAPGVGCGFSGWAVTVTAPGVGCGSSGRAVTVTATGVGCGFSGRAVTVTTSGTLSVVTLGPLQIIQDNLQYFLGTLLCVLMK
jgi:hypothetical protein